MRRLIKLRIISVLLEIGLDKKVKIKKTTNKEWNRTLDAYRHKYGTDLVDDIAK